MLRHIIGSIQTLIAIALAIILSSILFIILPVLQYKNMHAPLKSTKQFELTKLEQIIPQKKQNKPKPQKQEMQKSKSMESPKSMTRSRFSMDLAPGGGGGGVAIGGGEQGGGQVAYQEGEVDVDAEPIRQSAPKYPEEAQKAGVSGLVRCLLTIDERGDVIHVEILESPGNYGFEQSVREAVASWKYKPAQVDGIPVRQKIEQPFKF